VEPENEADIHATGPLLVTVELVQPFVTGLHAAVDKPIKSLYIVSMKTLTITDAKKNLGQWLAAAARGEDIGIVSGANIIALRKVEVESTDYAQREYGLTKEELSRAAKRMDAELAADKKRGRLRRYSGNLEHDLQ
jgi:antitoxin (DNA-binding transcriptional repressor) of toxin-antitoxin stability system